MKQRALAVDANTTLTSSAYQRLRQDILSAELKPGARITIRYLQENYEIGPTPLREALARLSADGFVIGEDNRGFRVPPVSLAALKDITDQRKLIECAGLRRSIEEADDEFESRLVGTFHALSRLEERRDAGDPDAYPLWEAQHRNFHHALISGAKSEWLGRFQDILFDQADRYRRYYDREAAHRPDIALDHKQILEATLERDADLATVLLARHIERVYAIAKASGEIPER
ncbi:MAG TPA: GntR family transcriptional regulator [Hyphomicrobiales bacterium]